MIHKDFSKGHCTPCSKKAIREQGIERMGQEEITASLSQLSSGWKLAPQPVSDSAQAVPSSLSKIFKFKNFATALAFTSKVGQEADAEGHHPAILLEWGSVAVYWWSHSLNGVCEILTQLHQNDFIMAAKTENIAQLSEGLKS